jgi:hypothetical protein
MYKYKLQAIVSVVTPIMERFIISSLIISTFDRIITNPTEADTGIRQGFLQW